MVFPTTDLPVIIEAAFGADPSASPGTWSFTSLTSRLIKDNPIRHTVTRRPGAAMADASQCSLSLNNDDGELTPLRAMSTKWPNVKRDVPGRARLRRADDTFTRTTSNGWGTSDSGHAWANVGGANSDYSTTGTQGSVAISATAADRITVVDIDGAHQDIVITCTTNGTPANGSIETGAVARYADSSNYYIGAARIATDGSITAYVGKKAGGTITSIATAATGLTTSTSKKIRFRVLLDRIQLKVWLTSATEPDTWNIDVFDTSLTVGESAGSYSRRNTGNTSPTTFTYDNFDTTHTFAAGFADSWLTDITPTTQVPANEICTTRLTMSGPLRYLSQGERPVRSPAAWTISSPVGGITPHAYWPMEDQGSATQFASALPGGAPIVPGTHVFEGHEPGTVTLSAESTLPGSLPLPIFNAASSVTAVIPAYTDTGKWTWMHFLRIPDQLDGESGMGLDTLWTGNAACPAISLGLNLNTGGPSYQLNIGVYAADLATVVASSFPFFDGTAMLGKWLSLAVSSEVDGSGFTDILTVSLTDLQGNVVMTDTLPVVPNFHGPLRRVDLVSPTGTDGLGHFTVGGASMGHAVCFIDLAFTPGVDTIPHALAGGAHVGETAGARFARRCTEVGVPYAIAPGDTETMGPQQPDTFLNDIALCAETDQAIVGEDEFALSFTPRLARYNRPVTLTIDLSTYEISPGSSPSRVLAPVYDDQAYRNEWTLTNVDGSSAIVADSVLTPLRLGDSATVDVDPDAALIDHAMWRKSVSTFDTHRYPGTPVDLGANPGFIGAWLGVTSGLARIVRTGLPSKAPDGNIDEIVDSFSQLINPRTWDVTYTGSPAVPWDVGVYGTAAIVARYDSAHSTLAAGYDADDVTLSVATAAGHALWRTGSSAPVFPMYWNIEGIRIKVNSISGSTSPQTANVDRSVDGYDKALNSGAQVRLWTPARYAL